MINILYEKFPDSITADGITYKIVTDYREWIRFADLISDNTLPNELKIGLLAEWLLKPPEAITGAIVDALKNFYAAKDLEYIRVSDNDETEIIESTNKPPVFSWKIDARYVLGDFRRFYNINLLEIEYLHWWEFKSLFAALPDDSACHKRMLYRGVNLSAIKSNAEKGRIRKIQNQIALPHNCSDESIADAFGGMM